MDEDEQIARLNDEFRRRLGLGTENKVFISEGVAAMGPNAVAELLLRIARYDFLEENNPSEKRRLGVVDTPGGTVAWRIFSYSDQDRTTEVPGLKETDYRVMEIGLASEVLG